MKIVLDTNVVVSGLLKSQGNPAQILTLARAGAGPARPHSCSLKGCQRLAWG